MIMIAGVLVALALFAGISFFLRDRGAVLAEAVPAAEGGAIVVTGTDAEGALDQMLVLLPAAEGGWRLITIPSRTVMDAPGHGFMLAADIFRTGGEPLLAESVAGLLGTPVGGYIGFDHAFPGFLASPADTINLRTERALATADGEVILEAGDNPASAGRAVDILAAATADDKDGPRIQALFYQGLRDALAALPAGERQALEDGLAGSVKTNMGAGAADVLAAQLLNPGAVVALPVTLSGGDPWFWEPDPAALEALVAGGDISPSVTIEIRNGTSAAGAVEATAARLEPLGIPQSLVPGDSGVEFEYTQIRCGSEALKEGSRVRETLGGGTIIKDDNLEKNQIAVIIGKDLVFTGP